VIAGLVYLRREEVGEILSNLAPRFSRVGAGVLLCGGGLAASAALLQEPVLLGLSFPLSLYGYLVWTRGTRAVAPLATPVLLLLFLIPVSQVQTGGMSAALQLASAGLATELLTGLGFPSVREGVVITTGLTTNTVTEACSGMSTLLALVLYGLVAGYIVRLSARRIGVVLAVLLPLALVVNSVRIAFISWLLYRYGEAVAEGPLHDGSGYLLFAVAYAVSMALCFRLAKAQRPQRSAKTASQRSPTHA
jgi:exosortase